MIPEPCTEGGDLHYSESHSIREYGDRAFTSTCGGCGRELYAASLGCQWVLASTMIKEEP